MLGRVIGLDLGDDALRAVELRQRGARIEIVGAHAAPHDGDPLEPERLRRFFREHDLATDRVVCALPSEKLTRRRLRLPLRDRRRLAQAVPFEVEGELPFALEDLVVEWEVSRRESTGVEVLALAAPREEVAAFVGRLLAAGIQPRVLEAEGSSLVNLAPWAGGAERRLLVDVERRHAQLCLLEGNRLRAVRPVGVGLEAFAPERGGGRLLAELVRAIAALEADLGLAHEPLAEAMLLIGPGARTVGFAARLAEATGLEAQPFAVPPEVPGAGVLAAADAPLFARALALAVRGTLRARSRTNLLRPEFAPRTDLRALARPLRSVAVLGLAVILLAGVHAATVITLENRRAQAFERALAQVWQQTRPGEPVPDDVPRALEAALRAAEERAEFLGVYGGHLSALDLLADISRRVPSDLPIVIEELAIEGRSLRMRGHAPSYEAVDRLQRALAAPPFTNVRVSEIQSDSTRGGNSFRLTLGLADGEGEPMP